MRITALTLAAALTLVHGVATAQGPWGRVKAWTGTATIEATDTRKTEWFTSTLTYKATGDFTISDDALGDGDHMMWPMPNPESAGDPAKYAAAYRPWQSRVVGSFVADWVDDEGKRHSKKCSADNQQAARLGVISNPGAEQYSFMVEAPGAVFTCSDPSGPRPEGNIAQADLQLSVPRGEPGPVSGNKTFTDGSRVIGVSFTMKPVK